MSRFILALCGTVVGLSFIVTPVAAQNLPHSVSQAIAALENEKESRSPAQRKLDSQLHYSRKMFLGQNIAPGVHTLEVLHKAKPDTQGFVEVDINADVNNGLLSEIRARGGQVINSFPQFNAVRAKVSILELESLANRGDVNFIRPADQGTTHQQPGSVRVRPSQQARLSNVRAQLAQALPALSKRRAHKQNLKGFAFAAPVDISGRHAHTADLVQSQLGITGAGVKVGVLSDGVNSLATLQGLGDLPAVTVIAGQAGSGDEGTAMLEIVYDMAPGAQLYFATALGGQAQMAANIVALQAAGCNIIVDDYTYFAEPVFQDGIIAQAVNTVTAAGVMYFSDAQNSGNLDSGTSGTWEGDYVYSGFFATGGGLPTAEYLNRFPGTGLDTFSELITAGTGPISVNWSDAQVGSGNDYDLFITDGAATTVLAASTNVQNGTQNPFEQVGPQPAGRRIFIGNKNGTAAARALHLDTERGAIAHGTSGNTFGHNAAATAQTVAAVDVATAGGGVFVGGVTNPVEFFSSDGLRKIFYTPAGTAITPGNLLFGTGGGTTLQKPDMTAANGTASAAPGFNPFFGTSAAAPHAAAIAALVKSARPSLTSAQIRTALNASALDIMAPGIDRDSGVGIIMALAAVQSLTTNVTIQSTPVAGLQFTVTGTGCAAGTYTTPQVLSWHLGSNCTVNFPTPQVIASGTREVFIDWLGDGSSDPRTITAPFAPATYTAEFRTQYFMTTAVNPATGGTVTGSGWYDTGTNAVVQAFPAPLFAFFNFTGSVTSALNPLTVLMNAPKNETANFVIPTITVVPAAAGQYSDAITLTSTTSPVTAGGLVISGNIQFSVNGTNVNGPIAVNPVTGVASVNYNIPLGQGTYTINAVFTPSPGSYFTASTGTNTLTVSREDAVVTPAATNPHAVKVNTPGGTAGPITVMASIVEKPDDVTQGNISLAVPVTCTLNPILPGTTYTVTATTSGGGIGGTLNINCIFPAVAVNAYDLVYSIGGNYYTGRAESILAVYDPSLGFVTGGGTVVNPTNGFTGEFGFNAKYLSNGKPHAAFLYIEHRPTGDVVVQGVAAQSLSIIGNSAVIVTKGVVNGTGNYLIITTVTDNGEPGINNDLFGMEVQNPNTTNVPDLTFLERLITGGNIQVPHDMP